MSVGQPHEDESLPPQLREALRIMSKRGPVVELDGQLMLDDLSATEEEPASGDGTRGSTS